MALIGVKFDVEIPDDIARECSDAQIGEWVKYELGSACILNVSPLLGEGLEATPHSVHWVWIKEPGVKA